MPVADEPNEEFFHYDNVTTVLSDIIDDNTVVITRLDSIDMKLDTLEAKSILYRRQEDEILRKEIINDAIHIQEEIESIVLVTDSAQTKKIDSIFSIVKDTIISKRDTIIRDKPIFIRYYTFLTPSVYVYRKNVKNRYTSAYYKNYRFYRVHILKDSVIKIEGHPGNLTSHDIAKFNAMTPKEIRELKKIIKEADPKLLKGEKK